MPHKMSSNTEDGILHLLDFGRRNGGQFIHEIVSRLKHPGFRDEDCNGGPVYEVFVWEEAVIAYYYLSWNASEYVYSQTEMMHLLSR